MPRLDQEFVYKRFINSNFFHYNRGIEPFDDGSLSWFPDFYQDDNRAFVLDAKYRKADKVFCSDDVVQIVAYMHILKASIGAFIYPAKDSEQVNNVVKNLVGSGGSVCSFFLKIPSCNSFREFKEKIKKNEKDFLGQVDETIAILRNKFCS